MDTIREILEYAGSDGIEVELRFGYKIRATKPQDNDKCNLISLLSKTSIIDLTSLSKISSISVSLEREFNKQYITRIDSIAKDCETRSYISMDFITSSQRARAILNDGILQDLEIISKQLIRRLDFTYRGVVVRMSSSTEKNDTAFLPIDCTNIRIKRVREFIRTDKYTYFLSIITTLNPSSEDFNYFLEMLNQLLSKEKLKIDSSQIEKIIDKYSREVEFEVELHSKDIGNMFAVLDAVC